MTICSLDSTFLVHVSRLPLFQALTHYSELVLTGHLPRRPDTSEMQVLYKNTKADADQRIVNCVAMFTF